MKSLVQYIKEALDEDNLYFKMHIFFQKDGIQQQLFNALYIDEDVDKAIRDGFLLKEFVDFIYDDIKPDSDKDYNYQVLKIIKVLRSKNYQPL